VCWLPVWFALDMKFSIAAYTRLLTALSVLFLVGCTASGPNYKTFTLPSGKQVRVMSIGQINFSQSAPALMLTYQTDLKVADKAALRSEADEIWSVFRNDVESANLNAAIISANEIPHGFIVKRGNSYNFVYQKRADGTWHCLDDSAPQSK
jgi:hypothetical protein